jgi:hypothetical protein
MENQNQESGSGQQSINIQIPSADNIAGRRSLIPIMFAIALLFFFFNFFTVSCGGQKFGSVTGINLVTGTELKDHDLFSGKETKGEKIPSNIWAIIAFASAIIGLGVFLIKEKNESLIGTGAGAVGFGSLIVLQFAIKNAIERKAEGSPIQTDFEFAYWGALIAFGIGGFISYLRMQKTDKIIPNTAPHSDTISTNAENIDQQPVSTNTFQQSGTFDLSAWLNKNIRIVIGALVVFALLISVYYFLLKPNPIKDAKNAALAFHECSTKYYDEMIEIKEEFIKLFDSYGFKKRQEAITKLIELQSSVIPENTKCSNAAQQKYNAKRNRYILNKTQLEKFDFAYNAQLKLFNPPNQDKLYSLVHEIDNKIAAIKETDPRLNNFQNPSDSNYQEKDEKLWGDFINLVSTSIKQRDIKSLRSLSNPDNSEFNATESVGMAAIDFLKQDLSSEQWELMDNALKSGINKTGDKKVMDVLVFQFKNNKWSIYGLIGD